jgi:hypothetical protein
MYGYLVDVVAGSTGGLKFQLPPHVQQFQQFLEAQSSGRLYGSDHLDINEN